jgi:hypothetical protein
MWYTSRPTLAGLAPTQPEGERHVELHEFEQRLIEEIADEIAAIATSRFKESLADGERVFVMHDGSNVKLISVDHYDVGGMLLTVEADDGTRYLVRFEIRSGHYAFEAVPFDP